MIKRRARNSKKSYLLKIGVPLYFVFCVFALIWLNAEVVSLKYELGEIDRKRTENLRVKKMMTAQRASFYSAEKIERVAVNDLGMTLPVRENIYYVKRTKAAGAYKASMK